MTVRAFIWSQPDSGNAVDTKAIYSRILIHLIDIHYMKFIPSISATRVWKCLFFTMIKIIIRNKPKGQLIPSQANNVESLLYIQRNQH